MREDASTRGGESSSVDTRPPGPGVDSEGSGEAGGDGEEEIQSSTEPSQAGA